MAATQYPEPSDKFLQSRYHFVQLLDVFQRNDFARAKAQSTELVQTILDYLSAFNPSFLTSLNPSPPFDLMLAVFINATWTHPNYTLLIKLFRHYVSVRQTLQTLSPPIFLNDRTRSSEIQVDLPTALQVTQSRIDYIAELTTSLLFSKGQLQLLSAFLTDFASPNFTENEETLSHLGRLALAFGDVPAAVKYFEKVQNPDLKMANTGYVSYFGGNFLEARKQFQEAKSAGPANSDLCLKHAGNLQTDPSEAQGSRKLAPEERSQWPAEPKPV